jgi:hypothetical protein
VNITAVDFTNAGNLSQSSQANTKMLEAERARAYRRVLVHMNRADDAERQLGVESRWTPGDPRYIEALTYVKNRTFIRVVENLEGLVVQRLFELSKANLATTGVSLNVRILMIDVKASTGYKMRKHISKAIAKRSAAIRTALDKYNELAPQQNPPRPVLQYSDVASYSWLGEFDLLKYSRSNITRKPWTVPANREVAIKYFKVQRAKEEIERLNVEVRRLDAWTSHENQVLAGTIQAATDPHLAAELRRRYAERRRVNSIHRIHVSAIYHLDGYTGPGHFVSPHSDAEMDPVADEPQDEGLVDEDDGAQDEVLRLGDFLDNLAIN